MKIINFKPNQFIEVIDKNGSDKELKKIKSSNIPKNYRSKELFNEKNTIKKQFIKRVA